MERNRKLARIPDLSISINCLPLPHVARGDGHTEDKVAQNHFLSATRDLTPNRYGVFYPGDLDWPVYEAGVPFCPGPILSNAFFLVSPFPRGAT